MARVSVSPKAAGSWQQPRQAASLQTSGIFGPRQLLLMVCPLTRTSTSPAGPAWAGVGQSDREVPLLPMCGVCFSTIPTCHLRQANDFYGTASTTNLGSVIQCCDVI